MTLFLHKGLINTGNWDKSVNLFSNKKSVYCWWNTGTGFILTMMRSGGIRKGRFFEEEDQDINVKSSTADIFHSLAVR